MTPTRRTVLRLGAVCMIVAGVLLLGVGAWAALSARDAPELTVSDGPEVVLPEAGVLGGSVTVYVDGPVEDGPSQLGCEVLRADGDVAQGTRMDAFTHALADPVTVEGATWHPLTEVDLFPAPATLSCPDELLSPAALSAPSTFGGDSLLVAGAALGFAPVGIVIGAVALLVLRERR
ncbi:hypothetical protein [Ornithinimicrobium avium]|uniref:hypothetical protein n=1 Tax=Ornithinimicrobium avium TaxID=2283195 RepID=UPI0013B3FA98|nr:hypothetical protein [Ornithinimicrobium avium]